ncbi:MAG: ABC transporter permease [Bryobacteraceae bacterium]
MLLRDFCYGFASLRRDPGFAVVAAGVLALGIGANTAMFSLIDGLFLKPLPFSEAERIVRVSEAPTPTTRNDTTTLTFLDWKKKETVFEALSVEYRIRAAATTDGEPTRVSGKLVSADYFKVFGVHTQIGRTFAPGEDQPGSVPVVVVSHGLWQARFGGDPDILNRELVLDGERHKVIGVLPPGSFDRDAAAFWKPLVFAADQTNRGAHWLAVVGRLRPGVSLEQARARMLALRASLANVMPAWKKAWSFAVDPFAEQLVGDTLRRSIFLAFGAALMVLLIACANVANLLLAKGAARRKEMAVRTALGASRGRLIRQLLAESLVLCLLGGTAGVTFAWWLIHAAVPLLAPSLPFTAEVRLDLRVLAFAAAAAMTVSLLVGLLPALQNSFGNLTQSLNHAARGSSGSSAVLRRIIVTSEVAISLVLICGALLLFKSLVNLQAVDAGIRIANVITMSVDLPLTAYPEPENAARFYRAVVQRLEFVPGVEQASVSQDVPLEGVRGGELIGLPGFSEPLIVRFKRVDPWYFDALDIPLDSGRGIANQDRAGAPRVMVINKELARHLSTKFGMSNPIGQAVRISCPGYGKKNGVMPAVQIVGIIRNERTSDLHAPDEMVVYVPLAQVPRQDVQIIVRTHSDPFAAISGIREAVRQIDPNLPLADIRTMEEVRQRNLSWAKQPTWVIGAFAGVAALLAALGLYGVVSHAVTQQRREIGIRMALGARPREVLLHVLRNTLSMVVVGLAIGLAGVFALARVMKGMLFQVSALDPLALTVACISMTLIGLIAGFLPARRAAKTDPVIALRQE